LWRRRVAHGQDELVLGLKNDGCSAPPGQITIQAHFPDGSESSLALPTGDPTPGAMKMYALPLFAETDKPGADKAAGLSMSIQIKGKKFRAQWAVRTGQTADPFVLEVPIRAL
jgi:hypothetical protein